MELAAIFNRFIDLLLDLFIGWDRPDVLLFSFLSDEGEEEDQAGKKYDYNDPREAGCRHRFFLQLVGRFECSEFFDE